MTPSLHEPGGGSFGRIRPSSPAQHAIAAVTHRFESRVVYDGDGNRVREIVGSATTDYLIDDVNPTVSSRGDG